MEIVVLLLNLSLFAAFSTYKSEFLYNVLILDVIGFDSILTHKKYEELIISGWNNIKLVKSEIYNIVTYISSGFNVMNYILLLDE